MYKRVKKRQIIVPFFVWREIKNKKLLATHKFRAKKITWFWDWGKETHIKPFNLRKKWWKVWIKTQKEAMDFFRVSEINLQKRLKIQKSLVMGMNTNLKGDNFF